MAFATRTQSRLRFNPRLLIIAAALALFASGLFAVQQAPVASADSPAQPTQSWSWGNNNCWGNNWWCNNNWWGNNCGWSFNNCFFNNCNWFFNNCYNNYCGPSIYYCNYYAYPVPVSYPVYTGYSWCSNNPIYYSYPSAFTCPISPLNSAYYWNPWWGYPYFIP